MKELLDSVLEADSQRQAQQRLEEAASGELAEEAPEALEVLEDGLFDATAVLALPEKYRKRLRTTKRGPAAYPRDSTPGEGDPDLSKQGVGLAARRCPVSRKTRGMVDWKALLDDGGVL